MDASSLKGLILRWDEELDLPRHLLSLSAPLTGPSNDDPLTIARNFVLENFGLFRLDSGHLETARVSAMTVDERAGFTRLALEQRVNGIRVFDSDMVFVIDRKGQVLTESGSFIPEIEIHAPEPSTAVLAPEQALALAAASCGAQLKAPIRATLESTPARQRVVFSSEELDSRSEASVVYYAVSPADARVAFQVLLYGVPKMTDSYLVLVDALTGETLKRQRLTYEMANPEGRVFTKENPDVSGTRELVSFAGEALASPQGWVEQGRTSGNNVEVQFNPKAKSKGGDVIEATSDGNFDFPLDLTRPPIESFQASATNLFYWVNVAHDRFYSLGFTESARNFQQENFDRGGRGGDSVLAQTLLSAQLNPSKTPKAMRNNAYFQPTTDGINPMLVMLAWTLLGGVDRDSSYDAGVIIHEYTHGVSTRLTGTDNSIGLASAQGRGMGEGWSDFFAISFLDNGDRALDAPVVVGEYLIGPQGVREFPYSTNFDLNPLTFADIETNTESHAVGTVWCTILYDLRQSLISRYGFEAGREAAEQLVVDGLKLTPFAPSFIDARNAILLADQMTNSGANQGLIWKAFARRGMGASAAATSGDFSSTGIEGIIEGYDVPPQFSAGSLVINDKLPAPAAVGEPLPLVVTDLDLLESASVEVRAANLRTGQEVPLTLEASEPGRFAGGLRISRPEEAGGPLAGLLAEPGDSISITYANARNETGAAEKIVVHTVAARRISIRDEGFEEGAQGWVFLRNGDGNKNLWHITDRLGIGSSHSLYYAKEKPSKSFVPKDSSGAVISTAIDLRGALKPRLEFDYFFNDQPRDFVIAEVLTNFFAPSEDPTRSAVLGLLIPDEAVQHLTFSLRRFENHSSVSLLFLYTASSSGTNRKNSMGIYIDNIRLTALSTQ